MINGSRYEVYAQLPIKCTAQTHWTICYVYDSHEYRYPGVLHYVYHEVRALPVAVTMRCHLSWML